MSEVTVWVTDRMFREDCTDGEGKRLRVVKLDEHESIVAALQQQLEELRASLSNPAAVHTNILRGTIALTKAGAIHIAGLPADIEQRLEEIQSHYHILLDDAVEMRHQLAAVSAERDAAKQSSAGLLMSFYSNKCDNESLRAELAATIREKEIAEKALCYMELGFAATKVGALDRARHALASASTEEGE